VGDIVVMQNVILLPIQTKDSFNTTGLIPILFLSRSRNIFAIQQNLLNITQSREPDLDKARLYYDLLYKIPGVSSRKMFSQV
jgi:hypothetical protein